MHLKKSLDLLYRGDTSNSSKAALLHDSGENSAMFVIVIAITTKSITITNNYDYKFCN